MQAKVTTWEDHSPLARDVQHAENEDRVMPMASFQKEAKKIASPVPPPRGRQQRQHIKRVSPPKTAHCREQSKTRSMSNEKKAGDKQGPLKCAAKMSQL